MKIENWDGRFMTTLAKMKMSVVSRTASERLTKMKQTTARRRSKSWLQKLKDCLLPKMKINLKSYKSLKLDARFWRRQRMSIEQVFLLIQMKRILCSET